MWLSLTTLFFVVASTISCTQISNMSKTNTEITFTPTQSTKMTFYTLSYDSKLASLDFVLAELSIDSQIIANMISSNAVLPMLCYEFNINPKVTQNPDGSLHSPCVHGYNLNEYTRGNGKYSVLVPMRDQNGSISYDSLNFGVFIDNSTAVDFTLHIRGKFSDNPKDICPFDCTSNSSSDSTQSSSSSSAAPISGICEDRTCVCPSNSIDSDCSQPAKELTEIPSRIQLGKGDLSPFGMSVVTYRSRIQVSTIEEAKPVKVQFSSVQLKQLAENPRSQNNPSFTIYVTVEGRDPKVSVPTESTYFAKFTPTSNQYVLSFNPSILYDGQLQAQRITFALISNSNSNDSSSNSSNEIITIQVLSDIQEISGIWNEVFLYIFLSITLALFVFGIALYCTIKKYQKRKLQVHNFSPNQLISVRKNSRDSAFTQTEQQQLNTQKDILNREEMRNADLISLPQSYEMIIQRFQTTQNGISQFCNLCNSSFVGTDECRITQCHHCFHSKCYEQMIYQRDKNQGTRCPACQRTLTRQNIQINPQGEGRQIEIDSNRFIEEQKLQFTLPHATNPSQKSSSRVLVNENGLSINKNPIILGVNQSEKDFQIPKRGLNMGLKLQGKNNVHYFNSAFEDDLEIIIRNNNHHKTIQTNIPSESTIPPMKQEFGGFEQ